MGESWKNHEILQKKLMKNFQRSAKMAVRAAMCLRFTVPLMPLNDPKSGSCGYTRNLEIGSIHSFVKLTQLVFSD